MKFLLLSSVVVPLFAAGITFEGRGGPGKGKYIVLVSGDEEYRSEEALPQLAKILANHHGFQCTVLFAIDPATGAVEPRRNDNIPGLEALERADLMILFTRWRDLPDDQMEHFARYLESHKPIIGIRTATHAFMLKKSPTYQRWSSNNKEWDGGFGRQVLGETWVSHHGQHGKQSTRGVIEADKRQHPILRGIKDGDIWGPTDVYTARPEGVVVLVRGQVLTGMQPQDPPLEGPKNDPMMPIAWTKTYNGARIFTTTMGSALDLASEGYRRLLVNATYWALGLEKQIPAKAKVDLVGEYRPSPFKFGGHKEGLKPEDFGK